MRISITEVNLSGDKFTVTINGVKTVNTSLISIRTATCRYLTVQDINGAAKDLSYSYSDVITPAYRCKLQRALARSLFSYLLSDSNC